MKLTKRSFEKIKNIAGINKFSKLLYEADWHEIQDLQGASITFTMACRKCGGDGEQLTHRFNGYDHSGYYGGAEHIKSTCNRCKGKGKAPVTFYIRGHQVKEEGVG